MGKGGPSTALRKRKKGEKKGECISVGRDTQGEVSERKWSFYLFIK